jgi:uncharacterized membrane protein
VWAIFASIAAGKLSQLDSVVGSISFSCVDIALFFATKTFIDERTVLLLECVHKRQRYSRSVSMVSLWGTISLRVTRLETK